MQDINFGNVKIVGDKSGTRDDKFTIVMENAKILFKNFSGAEKTYNGSIINEAGKRNICVSIDNPECADWLRDHGVTVKTTKGSENYDPEDYVPVHLGYKFPPVIKRHAGRTTVSLNEETVGQLDQERILCADLVINPSPRKNGDGLKCWLRSAHFEVEDDPFAYKYSEEDMAMAAAEDDIPF